MRSARIASTATAAGLRLARRCTGLGGAGCCDGVDRIGLAVAASQLAVGAIDFHDGHARRAQGARESGSVASGSFDPDTLDRTESPQPAQQRAMTGQSRREGPHPKLTASLIERGDHVLVAVCVDPGCDARGRICHGGHRHSFSGLIAVGGSTCRDGGQDRDEPRRQAPDLFRWPRRASVHGSWLGGARAQSAGSQAPCPPTLVWLSHSLPVDRACTRCSSIEACSFLNSGCSPYQTPS